MANMEPTKTIHIVQVDERASYHRDDHYPQLIFLGTVLRWSLTGNVLSEKAHLMDQIVEGNNFSLDATAAFLADHIESGDLSIFSVHSRLPLGRAEKEAILEKLRGLDGGIVGGLVDEAGLRYYVDGHQLFRVVMTSPLPVDDDFEKGGVWWRLAWDAPSEWHDELNPGTTQDSTDAETGNQQASDSRRGIVRRKRKALIEELQPMMPSIERDLRDASRQSSGLTKRAWLASTYWNMAEVVAWGVENGKITRDKALRQVTTEPTSELSILLKQLMK